MEVLQNLMDINNLASLVLYDYSLAAGDLSVARFIGQHTQSKDI